jgi:hypothetical protein
VKFPPVECTIREAGPLVRIRYAMTAGDTERVMEALQALPKPEAAGAVAHALSVFGLLRGLVVSLTVDDATEDVPQTAEAFDAWARELPPWAIGAITQAVLSQRVDEAFVGKS